MRRPAIALIVCAAAAGLALAPALAPVFAQAPTPAATSNGSGVFGNGPVDATSDSQERVDPQHIRLIGRVEVLQGTARLRSPQIDLFYPPRGQGAPGDHAATGGGALGKIERAEAVGPVYYVTPTQTATGDHGTYIAADDTITLTGHVTLTQGQSVSTGDKAVLHQKTGQALLTAAPNGVNSGRVRGVFYPSQPAAPGAPAAVKSPAPAPPKAAPSKPARR